MAEVKKTAPVEKAEKYHVSELIAAADTVFGQPRECVKVALDLAKTDRMTVAEAKKHVDAFLRREVK